MIRKDNDIFSLSQKLNLAKSKLLQYEFDNLRLKKENSILKEKQVSYSIVGSRLETELGIAKTRENEMVLLINKLNDIVQNQDQEIAELKEKNRSHQQQLQIISNGSVQHCCERQNRNFKHSIFGWMRTDESSGRDYRESKLLETESKLSEQIEVNKQLKQYLELMLLKMCENK